MHLNLMDPKLIIGMAVIDLIIVIGVALYVRKRRRNTAVLRKRLAQSMTGLLSRMGPNARPKRNWRIVRHEWEA